MPPGTSQQKLADRREGWCSVTISSPQSSRVFLSRGVGAFMEEEGIAQTAEETHPPGRMNDTTERRSDPIGWIPPPSSAAMNDQSETFLDRFQIDSGREDPVMRPRLTTFLLLGLLGMTFGAWAHFDRLAAREHLIEETIRTQQTIQSEIRLRSLLEGARNSPRGWILEVESSWFARGGPKNPLLANTRRPWMDTARAEQFALRHPENPLARRDDAAWWYNPSLGIVRARVPDQGTHRATIELYERVNRTP